MLTQTISRGQALIMAYGSSIDQWAEAKVDGALGAVMALLGILVGWRITSNKQKEETQKLKEVWSLAATLVSLAAIVAFFVHHHYSGLIGRVDGSFN